MKSTETGGTRAKTRGYLGLVLTDLKTTTLKDRQLSVAWAQGTRGSIRNQVPALPDGQALATTRLERAIAEPSELLALENLVAALVGDVRMLCRD